MERMTADTFLSRQTRPGSDMEDLFLPYGDQVLNLRNSIAAGCNPIAAGHGMELWHLGRFEEGAAYLQFARKGYQAQLADLAPEEREIFHKRFTELALLEELLALWEQKEDDWELAIRRKLDQTAADWSMYV